MKIAERHVIIFTVAMYISGIGLLVYLPFIEVEKEVVFDIEKLCKVEVEENQWQYIVLHHSATNEGSARSFDAYHREKKNGLTVWHITLSSAMVTVQGRRD